MFDCFDKPVWNDRESLFVHKPEVSGLLVEENIVYQYAYPESDYPILRLPFDIYDEAGNILPHGFYMIVLDSDRKYLLFIQSAKLKARVPVATFSEKMRTDKDFEQREDLAQKYQKLMFRGKQRNAKKILKELEIYDKRVRAKMSAYIDDKQEGVYILIYETAFQKAKAIIPIY